jgi:hypothetical protein
VWVLREHYGRGQLLSSHAEAIRSIESEYLGKVIASFSRYADHDAQDRAELGQLGLPTVPARKHLMPGIVSVVTAFGVRPDGRARLIVSPTCKNLIRELENYEWSTSSKAEGPRKGAGGSWESEPPYTDDAVDALRYAVHSESINGRDCGGIYAG